MLYAYIISAVLPAIFLMVHIYRLDRIEKEPIGLLIKLFLFGILASLLALVLEVAFDMLAGEFVSSLPFVASCICEALSIGVIEECSKFVLLKKGSWKNRAFDYRFDGIVYAVFVSLGFAAFENVLYVLQYQDLSTIVMRALLSIPGHMSFGIYMGLYYGKARLFHKNGQEKHARRCLLLSLLSAILFHTVFDACLMIDSSISFLCFIGVVLFMYIYVFRMVKVEAINDSCI